jgi:hypothetical protein
MKRLWPAALLLTACVRQPETYAPPMQRQPVLDGQAVRAPKRVVSMDDPEADAYIVSGLPKGERGQWRWAGKRPTVRLYVTGTAGLSFVADLSIADATFKDTGPVTLTYFVNGAPLTSTRFDRPGRQAIQHPIPPALLKPNGDNELAIEIDKVWIAPEDKAPLGFILASVGLSRTAQ